MFVTALAVLAFASPITMSAGPLPSHPEYRWGRSGHRVIARVAADLLSSDARHEVKRLLGKSTLAEISTWADEIRTDRPATGPWHYVNIPIWESAYRSDLCLPAGCVIGTLEAQRKILADRKRSPAERAEALRWVVHLVGDLHMPLHVGDRGDRGGNDLKIQVDGRPTNLHSLWDSGLLAKTGRSEEELVTILRKSIRRRGDLAIIAGGSVIDWAMESHDAARDVVYPFVPTNLEIDERYVEVAAPIVEDRMMRASVRLAAILEQALDD